MPFLAVFISPITKLTVTSMAFHMQTAETLPRSSMDRQWELSLALQEQIFPQTPPLLQNARSGTVAYYHQLTIKAKVHVAAPGTPGHLVAGALNTRRLVGRASSGWQSIREYRGQPTSECGFHTVPMLDMDIERAPPTLAILLSIVGVF